MLDEVVSPRMRHPRTMTLLVLPLLLPEGPRRRSHSHVHAARVEDELDPRFSPSVPTPPDPRRRIPRDLRDRDEEFKRRSYPVPIDQPRKLSPPFMASKRDSLRERDRRDRGSRDRESRDREREPRSKSRGEHKVSWKDISSLNTAAGLWRKNSKDSSQDESRPRTSRDDRDYRRRERDRERDARDSDRDREPVRPRVQIRRSSHEDVVRRDRDYDRDRDRDRERERDTIGRGQDNRSFRDRDRDRRAASPVRGVDGRRYPSHA
ncbi:hypothetical protein G7Y89_g7151 [Cudoniella acicularis]|uniref:Uncharacterized protein n=1 Tax=Cudoniella acicularis TaxID=354080 RepID=A0A8H4RJ45_9HELO|nr:hypothetical protein G7Y89_g7151 [Cudoniella acicularis]